MTQKQRYPFEYAILRYAHDLATGEFLNIGLALYCPGRAYFRAQILSQYGRLAKTFPGINGDFYRNYAGRLQTLLDGLQARVEDQQLRMDFEEDILPDTVTPLLASVYPPDDSSFQFDAPKGGLALEDKLDAVFDGLYERFITKYLDKNPQERRDDEAVWGLFKQKLIQKRILAGLQKHTVITPYEKFDFDHALKNGKWHVFEPTSFDLIHPKSIQSKVRSLHTKVELVKEAREDVAVWILVGRPSVNEGEVHEAFLNAMTLLNKKTKKLGANIFTEDRAEEFAAEIKELSYTHSAE